MLPKISRLTKRGSFTYVYNKGERKNAGLITLTFIKSQTLKIGFSVPNKVGNAVVRNKIKRRLRAVLREFLPILLPAQAVFAAKIGADKLSYNEIRESVYKLISNAKLIKTDSKNPNISG